MRKGITALLVCVLAAILLFGCQVNISVGTNDYLTGEEYPNAKRYQTGEFTYNADEITAVEVYWRSGRVELLESDAPELYVRESGEELTEDAAMHCLLEDGILRIRFCASGVKVHVNSADKHVTIAVPKGIDVSVHTTSAAVWADTLEQNSVLISAHSGAAELGTVTANCVDLSSSSGAIRAEGISAQTLTCSTSSGRIQISGAGVTTAEIETSSGSVDFAPIQASAAAIYTSSGNVRVTLPPGGAVFAYTSTSGRLQTKSDYGRKGDLYVFGSGETQLTVETASGDLEMEEKEK